MRLTSHIALCFCLILSASRAAAQVVGGQVVDTAGHALAHVGLRLIDSLSVAVDSTSADSSGIFYLRAPRPGVYLVGLNGAGLLPARSAPIPLARDGFEQRRIVLTVVPNVPVYGKDQVQRQVRPYAGNQPARYPTALKFLSREGEVALDVVVDSAGHPVPGLTSVERSTDSLFTASALRALATYHFYPAVKDNHPVASVLLLLFSFRMSSERCWSGPDSLTGRRPNERCN